MGTVRPMFSGSDIGRQRPPKIVSTNPNVATHTSSAVSSQEGSSKATVLWHTLLRIQLVMLLIGLRCLAS